jgi:phosphoribosyl 1,2-cyclic phosphodiesterase
MVEASQNALTVTFWGVRGSFPTAGAAMDAFGGHTPCIEVRLGERLFVIDAGSGIIPLGRAIGATAPPVVDLLFSHLHLDHTAGLSFFAPAFGKDRIIRTWLGNLDGETAEAALERLFAPPLFPVTLAQFPARFEHHGFHAGETLTFEDGVKVRTLPLKHPSGATGYRFEHGGRSVCCITDIEHETDWPPKPLRDFCAGADLIIFDAMYSPEEYARCIGWGHSTLEAGVALRDAAGAGDFAAFHHNPAHDDAMLAGREAALKKAHPRAFLAREGMRLTYAARSAVTGAAKRSAAPVPAAAQGR